MLKTALLSGVAVSVLTLAVSHAQAVDQVNPAGTTQSNVQLANGDSMTNSGSINDANNNAASALLATANATFIVNNAGANITVVGSGRAVGVNGNIGSLTNAGTIANLGTGNGVSANVNVGTLTNSGTISSAGGNTRAVRVEGTVGTLTNSGSILGGGVGSYGVSIGGAVTTLVNSGTISGPLVGAFLGAGAQTIANSGSILSGYDGLFVVGDVGNASNTGTIEAARRALYIQGDVGTLTNSGRIASTSLVDSGVWVTGTLGTLVNSGTISSASETGLYLSSNATSITNSGTISGFLDGITAVGNLASLANSGRIHGATSQGVGVGGTSDSIVNLAGGEITAVASNALLVQGLVGSITNAGLISSSGFAGIYLHTGAGTIVNSGTISGIATGAIGAGGGISIVNSGTITRRADTADNAIRLDLENAPRNDTVKLLTGSRIFGSIDFGNGIDTLDFADFSGNTLLTVPNLEIIAPGSRSYVWDKPNNQIAIFDLSGVNGADLSDQFGDMTLAIGDTIQAQLASGSASAAPVEPNAYAAVRTQTAAEIAADAAVMTDLDIGLQSAPKVWTSVLGGGAQAAGYASRFGGILGGGHVGVTPILTVGLTGGVLMGNSTSAALTQTLSTQGGVLGVYGALAAGPATITASLLGGAGTHVSTREVIAGIAATTATGNFSSLYIAPSASIAAPLVSTDVGTLGTEAGVSYVGGAVTGYTETGSAMNLTVGPQNIGFVDGRAGLTGKREFDTATVTVKAGVFAQSNFGAATVPVTVLGQTVNAVNAGSTGYGVYGGVGVSGTIGKVDLSFNTDASWRNDGVLAASAKAGIGFSF